MYLFRYIALKHLTTSKQEIAILKATTSMRTVRSPSCFFGLGEVEEDEAFLCLFFLAIFFAAALVLFLFFRSNATVKNLELPKRVHMRTPDVSRKNRGKCLSGVASQKKNCARYCNEMLALAQEITF